MHGVDEVLIEMLLALAQKVPLNKLEKGISTLGGGSPGDPARSTGNSLDFSPP